MGKGEERECDPWTSDLFPDHVLGLNASTHLWMEMLERSYLWQQWRVTPRC